MELKVMGKGNIERFDYWLNSFQHLKKQAQICCLWSVLNNALESGDLEKSMQLRKELTTLMAEAYNYLFSTLSTPGEMATVLNWECHIGKRLTDPVDMKLKKLLGSDLPDSILPYKDYKGSPGIIVPAVRTSICKGENFNLKIIKLSESQGEDVVFYWRELGDVGRFDKKIAKHINRGVYSLELNNSMVLNDFEYYIETEINN